MTVYYFTVLIIILWALTQRIIHPKNLQKCNKRIARVSFVLILLVIGLRHQSMGLDLYWKYQSGYLGWFDRIANAKISAIPYYAAMTKYEFGFILLNKVIGFFTDNRQVYLFICAALSILPVGNLVKKESKDALLSVAVFIGMPSFLYLFGTIRQSIAMGLLTYSFFEIEKRNLKKFVGIVLIAATFHSAALFFLLVYPAYRFKCNLNKRLVSLGIILAVFLGKSILIRFTIGFFKGYEISSDASSLVFFVFFLIYVFFVIITKIKKTNDRIEGLLNVLFLACCCLAFQGVTPVAARLGVYYLIFMVILVPEVVSVIDDRLPRALLYMLLVAVFMGYGLYRLYIGGESFAISYPFYWFWNKVS